MGETACIRPMVHQNSFFDESLVIDKPLTATKDSMAPFQEKEDIRKLRPELAPSFGVPQLVPPSHRITEEENLTIDSNLDKAIYARKNAYRDSLNEGYRETIREVRHKQLQQKRLHEEKDTLLKELEERAKSSEVLRWFQGGAGIVTVGLGLLAFATAIFTGGMGILGVLSAIAGGASGVMQGANGLLSLRSQEIRGLAEELKIKSELEHGKINALLASAGATVVKIHHHNDLCAKDERNRFGVKIF